MRQQSQNSVIHECMCESVNSLRFKNLVQQYQSMYPTLTVDVEDQLKKLQVQYILQKLRSYVMIHLNPIYILNQSYTKCFSLYIKSTLLFLNIQLLYYCMSCPEYRDA